MDVTLVDWTVAVFQVTGVRQYTKGSFPTLTVYGDASYPSLRLITCGGAFDSATGHYLSSPRRDELNPRGAAQADWVTPG